MKEFEILFIVKTYDAGSQLLIETDTAESLTDMETNVMERIDSVDDWTTIKTSMRTEFVRTENIVNASIREVENNDPKNTLEIKCNKCFHRSVVHNNQSRATDTDKNQFHIIEVSNGHRIVCPECENDVKFLGKYARPNYYAFCLEKDKVTKSLKVNSYHVETTDLKDKEIVHFENIGSSFTENQLVIISDGQPRLTTSYGASVITSLNPDTNTATIEGSSNHFDLSLVWAILDERENAHILNVQKEETTNERI